jgi:predicted site-specific integrase-resolvase
VTEVLTAAETAERLGIDVTTVRRWVMRGWVRPVLGSNPLRFCEHDVEVAYAARMSPADHARLDALAEVWRSGT